MKEFGLVSIITPSYNSAPFIAETIKAILNQSYPYWELLITDDCSNDNTIEIIKDFMKKDSRIKLFQLEKNCGAGVCRNRSIKEAKGKYIAFCDSDDYWMPQKLEKQINFMHENNYAFTYTSYKTCNESGLINGAIICKKKTSYQRIKKDNCIGCLTVIYDCTKLGKFYMPEIRKRQDWGLWIKLLNICQYAYGLQEPLAVYRLRTKSISHNKFSLLSHNIQIYKTVLGFSNLKSYLYFIFIFLPTYFSKKISQLINH